MDEMKDHELATETADEKSEDHEGDMLELPEEPLHAHASALTDSMLVERPNLSESLNDYAPDGCGKERIRGAPDAAISEPELDSSPNVEQTSEERDELNAYGFSLTFADGSPVIPTSATSANAQRAQGPAGSKRSKRRPALVRLRARDLRPIPRSAQITFDFLK